MGDSWLIFSLRVGLLSVEGAGKIEGGQALGKVGRGFRIPYFLFSRFQRDGDDERYYVYTLGINSTILPHFHKSGRFDIFP